LDNYQRLLDDGRFLEALTRNGQLLIVLPLVTIAIALTIAALFNQGTPAEFGAPDSTESSFSFPQIHPCRDRRYLWSYVYTPNIGLLNGILRAIGLGNVSTSWLTIPAQSCGYRLPSPSGPASASTW
jgi:N-acetylglucosamine transport system permease protein